MAQKRMFDRAILDTDRFMDLSMSAKALYFLLGMEADDEGFVSYKKVMRIHGGNEDDIKVLAAKNFIIMFKSQVVVITDWNKNNWLDSRRSRSTEYQTEKASLELTKNKEYVLSNGLASIEEYRGVENSISTAPAIAEAKEDKTKKETFLQGKQWNEVIDAFKPLNDLYIDFYSNKTERAALDHLARSIGFVKLQKAIQFAVSCLDDEFAPTITKPTELKRNYGRLQKHYKKVAKRKS